MKRKKAQFLIIAFFGILSIQAQKSNKDIDKILIHEKIEMYFEGWMTGDTTKIGKAMHSTCKLKNIKEGKVVVFDRKTYLGFFQLRPRRKNSTGRVVELDVTGNIASAKCEIDTPTFIATDYFNLMKVKGEWFIVDKIATSTKKE
ncbi:MAG: nuclear transport factor 2 family protein [Maribacter sp.]